MVSNTEKFQWLSLGAGVLTLIISIVFSPLLSDIPYSVQAVPFLISMVFLGLPHGAMDHLVPGRLADISVREGILYVSVLYLLIGGLYVFLWFIAPVFSLIFFILMTWFHWGQGDLYVLKNFGFGFMTESKLYSTVSLVLRGGIPMLVPLIAHPEKYTGFLSDILTELSVNTVSLNYMVSTQVSLTLTVFIGILAMINIISGLYKAESRSQLKLWLYDNLEIAVLLVFFFLLPPLFAVGVYFCTWHSLRHIARLSLIKDEALLEKVQEGRKLGYLKELGRNTFKLTLISLVMFGASVSLFFSTVTIETLIAVYLVFISVLTLPHVLVVSWMDYRQMNMWKHLFTLSGKSD